MTLFKTSFYRIIILLSINLALTATVSNASTILHQAIESQILADLSEIHPTANINITFNLPNTQKKYSKCKNFNLPSINKISSGGRFSLRLTCKQPNWSTYITFIASITYPVAVSRMHIPKGQLINSRNIYFIHKDITKTYKGYFTTPEPLFGNMAKRVIKKSTIVSPYMLDSPVLINKNDSVMIAASNGGLTITTIGTALQNGKIGKQISVRNNRSGKIIRAYVLSKGRVSITAK
ncbi:MAG: flagellar basal body P-ring formation chaperone FlgA [Oceanospirillaceae bacterium]